MFDELEEEGVDVNPDSTDRAIAWAIWARGSDALVTPEEGWAILFERYPEDVRFLLLNSYCELSETKKQSEGRILAARASATEVKAEAALPWSASYFLKKVERVAEKAKEELLPTVRDLLVYGNALLVGATAEEKKTVVELRGRLGFHADDPEPKRDDRDRAGLRLRRFERELLKEIDERTAEGQPLGVAAPKAPPPDPKDHWAAAVADTAKPRRKYAADAKYTAGELVEHPKFGVGVVTGLEPSKVVLLFESGTRKLVAG